MKAVPLLLDDPRPVRDFCHVDDFADAVLRACIVPLQGVIAINVATGTGTSIGDLAKTVIGILQRNIPVRENPSPLRPPKTEIHRLVGDPSRASHILGWHPTLALKAGLERSI